MLLSGGQVEGQGVAERIDERVNLRAQPALAATDRLIGIFFLARRRCAGGLAR
jgi:hypothetical protein